HVRTQEGDIGLTRPVEIVGVTALSGQEPHVLAALHARADARVLRHVSPPAPLFRRNPRRSQLGRGRLDRPDDVVITRAAAEIALEILADLLLARVRVVLEQRRRAHHHPRRAVAALEAVMILERLLDHAERSVGIGHSLDRAHLRPFAVEREDRAGLHRLAIEMHRAGAALRRVAADMRAGKAEPVAQELDQERAPLDLARDLLAVDHERYDRHAILPRMPRWHPSSWGPSGPLAGRYWKGSQFPPSPFSAAPTFVALLARPVANVPSLPCVGSVQDQEVQGCSSSSRTAWAASARWRSRRS